MLSAGQLADNAHVPVLLCIVTVAVALAGVPLTALTEQIPLVPMIAGTVLALVVALTAKLV